MSHLYQIVNGRPVWVAKCNNKGVLLAMQKRRAARGIETEIRRVGR